MCSRENSHHSEPKIRQEFVALIWLPDWKKAHRPRSLRVEHPHPITVRAEKQAAVIAQPALKSFKDYSSGDLLKYSG
jgi:hypothetical protein